ncbi:MAG: bifunctional lysylphosphatidylglycerol flippase/synthetase MprF [Gemmatimonadales bacterium]
MKPRLIRPFAPFLVAALFGGALWLLHHELARYRYRDILRAFGDLPLPDLITATGFAGLGYFALTAYDTLALRFLGRQLKYAQTALASFLAYALAHTLGFSFVTSSAVRYRLYSNWGLSTVEVAGITAFAGVTYWLGALTIGGAALLLGPSTYLHLLPLPVVLLRIIGALALLLVAAYLVASALHRQTIKLAGREIALPGPGMAFMQLAASLGDWLAAAATLYAILPAGSAPPFPVYAGIFLLAQLAGVVSHVPGGLGVFETVMLLLIGPGATPAVVLASILAYRAIYYLLPFVIAVLTLGGVEIERHRRRVGQTARATQVWTSSITPRVLSVSTFLAGVVLLLSGATPAAHARLAVLAGLLPLAVIEVSHFVGSLVGFGLIMLAWGLRRRLNAAYHLTIALLVIGIAAALLRGLDFVEAGALVVLFAALAPAGRHFHRRALLGSEPLTTEWVLAIATALLASLWLGAFAYQHTAYSTELWWRFALRGDAPRFLRAEFGVLVAALGFVLLRLLRPAPPEPHLPTPAELDLAESIVARSPRASSHLALLGDRYLLFNEPGTAFLPFAVSKRSWIAFGDPVGPPEEWEDLAWGFREMADQHGGRTAFYAVRSEGLPLYLDLGLTPVELGREARVPLGAWSLERPERETLRHAHRTLVDQGYRFEVVPPGSVSGMTPELQAVSDAWLAARKMRDGGLPPGRLDERYLRDLPLAVVRRSGIAVAFTAIWPGGEHEEVSADLIRHRADEPMALTDFFLCELLDWGRREGYRWFSLGVAPVAGAGERSLAPPERAGLGEHQERFGPEWTPVYLAVQGRRAAANVLADVAALVPRSP